jgi:hypothetical protein
MRLRGIAAHGLVVARKLRLVKNKKPRRGDRPVAPTRFFGAAKNSIYNSIELEVPGLCLDPSGSSKQPVKPTIINAIAIRDKILFIRISSKGVSIIFINLRH